MKYEKVGLDMFKKILSPFLLLLLASASALVGYSYALDKNKAEETRVAELLDIYKSHLLQQLKETDNWVGFGAMNQLDVDIDLLKTSESDKPDKIELMRKLVWYKVSLTIEDLEKVCEVKTYPRAKKRCLEQIEEAHFYLEKYAHYKEQI